MKIHLSFNKRGITLIELLVAFVIGAMVVAGIYRIFVAQSRAYTVQDQVVEVQQNIRSGMEILLKYLRMAGYNGNRTPSRLLTSIFPGDFAFNVSDDAVRIEYAINGQLNTRVFFRNAPTAELMEDLYIDGIQQPGFPTALLGNVNALTFSYGVDGRAGLDGTQDGTLDDFNNDGNIDDADFVPAATVTAGNLNVIGVRVLLTARPETLNAQDDRFKMVQPRTLVSAITIRNLCLFKTN